MMKDCNAGEADHPVVKIFGREDIGVSWYC